MTGFAFAYAAQTAGVLLAAAVAAHLLRSKPAALRHSVGSLALAAILALPLLSIALSGHQIELRLPGIGPRSVPPAGAEATAPAPERDFNPGFLRLPDPLAGSSDAGHGLLEIWLLGTSILLARCVAGRILLHRLVRSARPIAGARIQELLAEGSETLGCRRRVLLLAAEQVSTPAAFGILRPVIVLPAGWEAWPLPRTKAVLLHELAHVARFDAVAQLLAEIVRALHWFDPLAWYAAHRLARDRERACDDAVLRAGVGSRDYAACILEAAREIRARPAWSGMLPIVARTELESRLVAILDPAIPRERTRWTQRLRLALLAAGCAAGLACLHIVPAVQAAEPPPVRIVPLDDPRSEIVPVASAAGADLSAAALRNDAERAAFQRLRAAATHVKTWDGDLVRERAEWALRQTRDGEIVSPLLRALGDPDWRVQAYAAWALGVAADRRAVGPLLPLLEHPVWRLRSMALYALLDLDADLPPARVDTLATDPAWQVRIGIVEYLARRNGPEALAGLRALASDPHRGTRMTAQAALAQREARTR
jgi:beta-lactamase regulating signal transducer with metallopeptidase domain